MMRRLRTGAWSALSFSSRESLNPLERVESLRVQDEKHEDGGAPKSDTLVEDPAFPVFNLDFFQDTRRQVYSESLIFRTTPFYAGKVRLEQRVDEHHLLRMHLAALERSERNGPLLVGDEYSFMDSYDTGGGGRDTLTPGGGIGRPSSWAVLPSSYGGVPSQPTRAGPGAGAIGPGTRITAGGVGLRRYDHQAAFRYGMLPGRGPGGPVAQKTQIEESDFSEAAGEDATREKGSSTADAGVGPDGVGLPLRRVTERTEAELVSGVKASLWGGTIGDTSEDTKREKRWGRGSQDGRGSQGPRQTSLQRSAGIGPSKGEEGEHGSLGKIKRTSNVSRRTSIAGFVKGSRLGGMLGSRWTGGSGRDGSRGGGSGTAAALGALTGDTDALQRPHWLCTVGGEPHVLNWAEWLKRQRNRGWFTSETLYYMTVFGAVVGAGDLTSFWNQLQVWHSSMFFIPYLVAILFIGLPMMQLEILTGNLFRGAPVKCFTQLSPWLLGAGVLTFISNFLSITLIANRSGQLLIYFMASLGTPHPWQLTADDIRICMNYSGQKQMCEDAMHGTLCHYIDDDNTCMPSPTGKATYYYLSQLQPYTLDPTTNPDALQGKMIGAMAFVWCYILAYIWRGLFKLGFLSAVLMFVAVVLCITLIFVSFFIQEAGGAGEVTRVIMATFDFGQLLSSLGDSNLSASIVEFALTDMTLGCGVFTTISSFTKIGYNVAPSGWYTAVVDFAMSTVAFAALLAVVGRIHASTGISVRHIVAKTGGAASYFVIFPAAFEKVAASNVFAMFFYGAIFVLNTQVAAIAIHCMINSLMEARGFRAEHHKVASVLLVVCSFVFCIPFCCANQQVRVDYFSFLVHSFILPSVVLVHSLSVGWFHNVSIQIRLAGKKVRIRFFMILWPVSASRRGCREHCEEEHIYSTVVAEEDMLTPDQFYPNTICLYIFLTAFIIYSVLCTATALIYCVAVGCFSTGFVTPLCYPFVWNTVFAVVIAAAVKDPLAAPRFGSRFWALYVGNIESFRHEVCRQTLFDTRSTLPLAWFLKSLYRIVCFCMRDKPFLLCRPSLFWSFTIKHLVPTAMLLLLVHGVINFPHEWARMAPSPNLRGAGLGLIIFSWVISIAASTLPRRYVAWICPPPADYMPIQCYPYHPYKPPVYVPIREAMSALFREFMRTSYRPSFYLAPLLTEYRLHHVRQHQLTWEAAGACRPPAGTASASSAMLYYSGMGLRRESDGETAGAKDGKMGAREGAPGRQSEKDDTDFEDTLQVRGIAHTTSVCSAGSAVKERRRHPLRISSRLLLAALPLRSKSEDRRRHARARRGTSGAA